MIDEIIPKQGFEQVGEVIGAVLSLELAVQKTRRSLPEDINCYHERITPYDKGEGLMVNVMFDSAKYDSFTESNAQGPSIFNIDVYATGRSSQYERGGTDASKRVQMYLGMCRYILQSTKYKTLGLEPGFIGGTYVDSMQMYDVQNVQDAASVKMGRLSFSVRIQESQSLWDGVDLINNITQVKLHETDLGYKYLFQ